MVELLTIENAIALATLTSLEIVLAVVTEASYNNNGERIQPPRNTPLSVEERQAQYREDLEILGLLNQY